MQKRVKVGNYTSKLLSFVVNWHSGGLFEIFQWKIWLEKCEGSNLFNALSYKFIYKIDEKQIIDMSFFTFFIFHN